MHTTQQAQGKHTNTDYIPNWTEMRDMSPGDRDLPLSDADLYPELDDPELNVILDPDDNPDYINQSKMRH